MALSRPKGEGAIKRKDGGSAPLGVETVMTAGNGFLLDRHKPTLQAKANQEKQPVDRTRTRTEWPCRDFPEWMDRIALGMTRTMRAVVTAQETAIPTQYRNPDRFQRTNPVDQDTRKSGLIRPANTRQTHTRQRLNILLCISPNAQLNLAHSVGIRSVSERWGSATGQGSLTR